MKNQPLPRTPAQQGRIRPRRSDLRRRPAVYSKSDPRAVIFKGFVERLSEEKGLHDEFELYNSVERLAPAVIAKERQMYKGVSVNVDFYSGFVYKMLGLPMELYTPIFAIARMVGLERSSGWKSLSPTARHPPCVQDALHRSALCGAVGKKITARSGSHTVNAVSTIKINGLSPPLTARTFLQLCNQGATAKNAAAPFAGHTKNGEPSGSPSFLSILSL